MRGLTSEEDAYHLATRQLVQASCQVGWFVACLTSQQQASVSQGRICLTSQQQASVSQGRICTDNYTRCYTETEVAHQTINLAQSQYTDTEPTSPSTDPITPGRVATGVPTLSHWYDSTKKNKTKQNKKKPAASGIRTPDLPLPRWTP